MIEKVSKTEMRFVNTRLDPRAARSTEKNTNNDRHFRFHHERELLSHYTTSPESPIQFINPSGIE